MAFSSLHQFDLRDLVEAIHGRQGSPKADVWAQLERAVRDALAAHPDGSKATLTIGGTPPLDAGFELEAGTADLEQSLARALNAELLRQLPFPPLPKGTLGHALESGGDWLVGCSGRHGDVTIVVERTFLDYGLTHPTRWWMGIGFVVRVEKADATVSTTISQTAVHTEFEAAIAMPTAANARPAFESALAKLAERAATTASFNGNIEVPLLLASAFEPPAPRSLFVWCEAVVGRLAEKTWAFGEALVGLTTSFSTYGSAALRPYSLLSGTVMLQVPLGGLSARARGLDVPPASEPALIGIVETFERWLDECLAFAFATQGVEFWTLGDNFQLLDLLEARLVHGAPPALPVPPFDEEALARAGRSLLAIKPKRKKELEGTIPSHETARPLAMFDACGWAIVLTGEKRGRPHGNPGISIAPPGDTIAVPVLVADPANPETRWVVDGDAFALRRLLEWLRAGISRAGLDGELAFRVPAEIRDEGEAAVQKLSVTDWLRFGLPDTGDRFLVDFRHQWHVAQAQKSLVDEVDPAIAERIRTRDIPLWRTFLRDVIDPRFGATVS